MWNSRLHGKRKVKGLELIYKKTFKLLYVHTNNKDIIKNITRYFTLNYFMFIPTIKTYNQKYHKIFYTLGADNSENALMISI